MPPKLTLAQLWEGHHEPLPEVAPHLIVKNGEHWLVWSKPLPKVPAETIYELAPKGPFHVEW